MGYLCFALRIGHLMRTVMRGADGLLQVAVGDFGAGRTVVAVVVIIRRLAGLCQIKDTLFSVAV
jgi:hypothetical protein